MRWRSWSRTPLFVGIARVSGCTGAGSRDAVVAGRGCRWKYAGWSARWVSPIPYGAHPGFTVNSSSSASRSGKPLSRSTWLREGARRPKAGRRSSAIMPMGSPRWICLLCQQSRFVCSTAYWSWGMVDDRFYGLALHRTRAQNGSQIRSRKRAAGNRLPAIWSAIAMGPMVKSSSEDFDQWAFAIDRHRRAPHGKTHMLKGWSVRSDGNALTTLSFSASDISVTYCCRTWIITMRCGRTYRWTRMHRHRALFRELGTFFAVRSWAGCITNMFGFDLRQAQWWIRRIRLWRIRARYCRRFDRRLAARRRFGIWLLRRLWSRILWRFLRLYVRTRDRR